MFNRQLRIETERLVIRALTEQDRIGIYNIMKDKEMYLYTPDNEWGSIEKADEFLKLVFWLYDLDDSAFRHFFAVTDKQNGMVVGLCGVGGVEYDRKQNEIFYHIGKEYWGMGYATEAAKSMLQYGFDNLGLDKIIGIVHKDNTASNRVMEKIGMKKIEVLSGLPDEFDFFNGEYLYLLEKDSI